MIPLRVLIVDDNETTRRGLRSLLSSRSDWMVCGEAADGLEAVERAKALRPNAVLMDVSMPRMNGLDATRILRREVPESRVIIVSQNDPDVVCRQAEEVDAAGFVAKNNLSDELLPTLDRLFRNGNSEVAADPQRRVGASVRPDWLEGGGALGQLIREHDWAQTSLGPIENWPQSLKTSVNLILNSRHPMWVGWGPDAVFLYNDAYIQVLSLAKHPWALGKPTAEVWPEIWDVIGPLLKNVYERGEASFLDDVRLLMNRGDFLEETYYSFSYSPIRDESGVVAGLFCPSTEVTPKVINARRLGTLAELSATSLVQKTTEAACASAVAALEKNPDDIPFALLYLIDGEGKVARLEQSCGLPGAIDGLTPVSVELTVENRQQCFWPLAEVVKEAQSQVVSATDIAGLPLGAAQQQVSQVMVLPITSRGDGGMVGVLVAGVNPARRLDAEYRTFFELAAGQIATAILNVRAAEEERKRLEALAEIDRAKTAFFSNVSHEFRTPLTLMLGPVEDLLSRSHTDLSPAAKNQLELVNRNGSRLLRLVNTLLDFSRLEAGRMQGVYEPTNLSHFTLELASVFRSATERAGLKLELDCSPLAEPVFVDRSMWEKIVLNLISNAFKFTFEGTIGVSLRDAGDNVELRVRDTGVGIPAEELPRLFDRFHRIENSRSRTHEGSGIGLALVQELAKLHGGFVRVESVLGQGSTFLVSLPKGKAHLAADRIGATRTRASTAVGATPYVEEALRWLPDAGQSHMSDEILPMPELVPVPYVPGSSADNESESRARILVVDDNADMRQYLVRLLAERYEVLAAPDGRAALESVRERPPDLVLTDVMMPNLDGFGLLRELRSDAAHLTIPIILLSARAGEEARVEGIERGADDYLIKPFSAREMLARVQTHLELSRVRKQTEERERQMTVEALAATAKFRAVFDETPVFAGIMTVDGIVVDANRLSLEVCGYRAEEVIGRPFWNTGWWSGSLEVQEKIRNATEQAALGVPFRENLTYHWADGTERLVDFALYPIRDHQGQIIFLHPTGIDITDLKHAEENYRMLVETLDAEVQARTRELEARNVEVVRQSELLRELSRRLMQAQDDERRHVARELHDSAGQTLTALGMNLAHLAQQARNISPELALDAEEGKQLVLELSQEIRTMSYLLHPPLLDDSGIGEALHWYIRGLEERSGLRISLVIPEELGRFSHELELSVFRIVQECLTNVHRHSGSKVATIRIVRGDQCISLEVRDQGKGISPEKLVQLQAKGGGVGIRGMRERVLQLGGEMKLNSEGSGTLIAITIPFANSVQTVTGELQPAAE
jgi:PAS domain S-box-containing protein